MLNLFIATLCSASIALVFKFSEARTNGNRLVTTTTNYAIALLTSLFMVIKKEMFLDLRTGLDDKGFNLFKNLMEVSDQSTRLSAHNSMLWGALIGSVAGVFFFLAFIYYQKSVKENGASLSGAFAKIGILIPMTFSIIIWREIPTLVQAIGIVLAIISIMVANLSKKSLNKLDFNWTLLFLFFLGGMAEFSNKIYQQYALNEYKEFFLFFVFLIAFLLSGFYTLKEKSKIKATDVLTGIAVGIPNLFSSFFLILALEDLPTSVVFPFYSAGSIIIITLGSWFLFKEKVENRKKLAILLTVVALILIY